MARRNLHSWAALAVAFGGFAACTFGASDFEIVPAEGSGATSGNGNNSGGAPDGTAGSDEAGGGDVGPSGGAESVAGSGAGAEPGVAGAGGADGGPRFICSPLTQTFDVLTPTELENRPIQGDPFLVEVQGSVIVGVATSPLGISEPNSKLFVRPVSDRDGGSVEPIGSYTINGNRFQIVAAAPDGSSFTMLGVSDAGIFDLTYTTADGGRTLQDTSIVDLPMHEVCDSTGGYVDGSIRDVDGFYDGDWTYAATCSSFPPGGGTEQNLSLWLKLPENPSALAIPTDANPDDLDDIVREFVKVGDTMFMLVGNEVGESIGVRTGTTREQMGTVSKLALSDDPLIFTSVMIRPVQNTLFVHGSAFTTDGTQSPPLVPAKIYDGSVGEADLYELLVQTDGSNAPPSPLQNTATFTKASELAPMEDAIQLGQENMLLAGTSFAPRNRVNVAVVSREGVALTPPIPIYETESPGTTIADHSLRIAHLGIGFLAVWIEDGTVKARSVSCLQD